MEVDGQAHNTFNHITILLLPWNRKKYSYDVVHNSGHIKYVQDMQKSSEAKIWLINGTSCHKLPSIF